MLAAQERHEESPRGEPHPEERVAHLNEVSHGSNYNHGDLGGGEVREPGRGHHSRPQPSTRRSRYPEHIHVGEGKRREH